MEPRPTTIARLLTALAFALLLLAPLATANGDDSNGNPGTIKVHDESDADPDKRNEPHVDCDFWVEGFNMAADSGTLTFYSWPPTGDKSVVHTANWTADDGEPAHHFLAGPFTLPAGHYRVEASNADDHVKSKVFWVDECDDEGQPGEPGEHACPTDLKATANQDGSITLAWKAAAGSDGTNLYRAVGNGDLEHLAELDAGVETYKDTTTTPGGTYSYSARAAFGDTETGDCPIAETTAIPEFPTVVALGLASGGSLLAFALANRRKT